MNLFDVFLGALWAAVIVVVIVGCIAWAVPGPSDQEIMDACRGHGPVVSYQSTNSFSFDADARVVCKDGTVVSL
jgi:hypothetical protein